MTAPRPLNLPRCEPLAPQRWRIPDGEDRCPGCGRFVALEDGYCDVEPGGVRGSDCCEYYCSETCTAYVRCAHGIRLSDTCDRGCEQ